ncbi:MAG: lipid-binding SYLF domain-containing protein [Planctomycetota bacterium]|jgi:lipid-binding SYLF domain-containing protein
MKQLTMLLGLFTAVLVTSGCGPSAQKYTLSERRQLIDNMAEQNLQRLYIERPMAQQEIAESAGYAVFSNANVHIIFFGGGGGYGVAVDKTTGRKTYMNTSAGGVGFGLGAKDYRQVIIFKTRKALTDFVGSGWGVGSQADATAKTATSGGDVSADGVLGESVKTYVITKNGLALQATISGTRYWVDDDLNQPTL